MRAAAPLRLAVATLVALSLLAGLGPGAAAVPTASGERQPIASPGGVNPASPLNAPWGFYDGHIDPTLNAYRAATPAQQQVLSKVALRHRMIWTGHWVPTRQITGHLQHYISTAQHGDPNALVQLAIFRLWPQGEWNKRRPFGKRAQAAYRNWIDAAARGVGDSRVAIVLEPDLAVALKGWRPRVRLRLARYAARVLGSLPRASVYIGASDADWLPVGKAVSLLMRSGVGYVRGFALGATHYGDTGANIAYGNEIINRLAARGVPDRHMVIDTADNGAPFTWKWFYATHRRKRFDNGPTCTTPGQQRCITLGIPPTPNTADPAHVDAYLWFGRPWLRRQNSPFVMGRALSTAASTPY